MIEDPTYCFLINTSSNASRAGKYIENHERSIKKAFPEGKLIYIREGDSIAEIASAQSEDFSHIIACGGDGTVNQVVNGIVGKAVILGVIPIGSGNDFAKSLGLSTSFEECLNVLKAGKTRTIDVVNHEWGCFVNTFGLGVDGLTNYYASKSPFKRGWLRYFWGGLKALFHAQTFIVSVSIPEFEEPLTYKSWMVTVANGKNEGGRYTISPTSCNSDGQFEIIVVKDITKLRLVYEFLKLSIGFPFDKRIVDVFTTKTGCKTETNSRLKTHADGEQISTDKVNKFRLLPGAINVVINEKEIS